MKVMKAITVPQPWATLLVTGEKQYETRCWKTHYRGPLLIHAGVRCNERMRALTTIEPFFSALENHGIKYDVRLPLGALVGWAMLEDCLEADKVCLGGFEERFGRFRPGHWAWRLANPVMFATPIPWQGKQSIFEVPTEVCRRIRDGG